MHHRYTVVYIEEQIKEKEIKEILGTGAITSGSNNTKVDFTIIIGKDYK